MLSFGFRVLGLVRWCKGDLVRLLRLLGVMVRVFRVRVQRFGVGCQGYGQGFRVRGVRVRFGLSGARV